MSGWDTRKAAPLLRWSGPTPGGWPGIYATMPMHFSTTRTASPALSA